MYGRTCGHQERERTYTRVILSGSPCAGRTDWRESKEGGRGGGARDRDKGEKKGGTRETESKKNREGGGEERERKKCRESAHAYTRERHRTGRIGW